MNDFLSVYWSFCHFANWLLDYSCQVMTQMDFHENSTTMTSCIWRKCNFSWLSNTWFSPSPSDIYSSLLRHSWPGDAGHVPLLQDKEQNGWKWVFSLHFLNAKYEPSLFFLQCIICILGFFLACLHPHFLSHTQAFVNTWNIKESLQTWIPNYKV